MYLLFELLHREGAGVTLQARQLLDGQVLRARKRKFAEFQHRITIQWQKFANEDISLMGLVRAISGMVRFKAK